MSNALSGLHFFQPLTRRRIPTAWKLFATWKKLEWPARAPPLTCDIVLSLAYYALCHDDLVFASLLCLGFFTVLRTGELLNLKGRDLLLNKNQVVVSLKNTRTGRRNATDEMVTTNETFVLLLLIATLRELLDSHEALDKPLWGFSFPRPF